MRRRKHGRVRAAAWSAEMVAEASGWAAADGGGAEEAAAGGVGAAAVAGGGAEAAAAGGVGAAAAAGGGGAERHRWIGLGLLANFRSTCLKWAFSPFFSFHEH